MSDKQTPLLRQYNQIKSKHPDTVLLFRLGDFFETFNEDAEITAKVCGITLTKRNNGGAADMPLAGFPHHQLDAYLPKLVKAGYRVAVCEQLEDPKLARGIVKRGVVEVVTPGVALYDKLLEAKTNNYLACIYYKNLKTGLVFGLACLDISTGEFLISEFDRKQLVSILENFHPSELIFSKAQYKELENELEKLSYAPAVTKLEDWIFDEEFSREALKGHFDTNSLKGFGIDDMSAAIASAGAIMHYIKETQITQITHIKAIATYNPNDYMMLDYATRRNLEITFSNFDNNQGTLISTLDKTKTAMGGRLFKKWITRPLLNLEQINSRLEAVTALIAYNETADNIRANLSLIGDMERLISKICTGRANPRDVAALKNSIKYFPIIKNFLLELENKAISIVANKLSDFSELYSLIDKAMVDEPTALTGSGNVFRGGYSSDLDEYIDAKFSGKNWISEYQEKERAETGINSLKVSFNNVFGYYIEITKTHNSKAPDRYERKQTLANAERYTTPELKQIESKILNAETKIAELEQALFTELKMKIALHAKEVQDNAYLIAVVDCLQSFSQAAIDYNYAKPIINESDTIKIVDGRHPVVERLLPLGEKFVPNSTYLNNSESLIHIITGPNMAGKSCYLRQIGLIILLGQIGCYVPAKSAEFGIVDRIFTRVGAHDNITAGESTFLIEMQEAANILNNATEKSLILLDEIGRGTATFDGISIAWGITEFIHDTIKAKTLFATHYHELNDLISTYDKIRNYQVHVIETGERVLFTHKVIEGGADHSYGIYVAKIAGIPHDIITRAKEIMSSLEKNETIETDENPEKSTKIKSSKIETKKIPTKKRNNDDNQISIFELRDDIIRDKIRAIDLNNITPFNALELLKEIKDNL